MIGNGDSGRRWSIGELARASGLTVRTLYHYDEIGLLSASDQTRSGHRRYTEADLRRLYRVRALRGLGLSLNEIAAVLGDTADDLATLRDLLITQLGQLDVQVTRITQLTLQIRELLNQIDGSAMPDSHQFMTTLEMLSMFEIYFTPQQRDFLAARRAELGEEAIDAAKRQWVELVKQIREHQQAGTPVTDPRVQALVTRWDDLAAQFHGGDEHIRAAASTMWEHHHAELGQRMGWPPDQGTELVGYLTRARQAFNGSG